MKVYLVWQSNGDIQEPDELYYIYAKKEDAQYHVDVYNSEHKDTQFPYYMKEWDVYEERKILNQRPPASE